MISDSYQTNRLIVNSLKLLVDSNESDILDYKKLIRKHKTRMYDITYYNSVKGKLAQQRKQEKREMIKNNKRFVIKFVSPDNA